ncbi:MAG: metallophosphoesterase, partial [Azoarcus sp.]|nr:metallophosphoesterase [Azoarcus sp.]
MSGLHIFSIIKGFYVVINIGLIVRLYFALRGAGIPNAARLGACLLAIALSLSFPISRMIEGNGFWAKTFTFTGTFWLAFVLHAVLVWALIGIFRFFNQRFHWLVITPARQTVWQYRSCMGIVGVALLVNLAGWVNVQYPMVREVKLPAPAGTAPLRIVLLSDTHLGRLASPAFFNKVIDRIEPLSPDIVLFAGDIIEYDYDPEDVEATAAALRRLEPRLGIWGVTGNHEY